MIRTQTRTWGNSLGIIIPSDAVKELNLRPHEEVIVEVRKKSGTVLKALFGALAWKKPLRQALDEARSELESRY